MSWRARARLVEAETNALRATSALDAERRRREEERARTRGRDVDERGEEKEFQSLAHGEGGHVERAARKTVCDRCRG